MLERWQVLVRLMGRHLHTRTATINAMMTVVERAFKLPEQNILAATFRAWQDLMDCFALDPKILRNTKRINLLVRITSDGISVQNLLPMKLGSTLMFCQHKEFLGILHNLRIQGRQVFMKATKV